MLTKYSIKKRCQMSRFKRDFYLYKPDMRVWELPLKVTISLEECDEIECDTVERVALLQRIECNFTICSFS